MVDKISLEGMYDLHVHAGPSLASRKVSALEALRLAVGEGMKGILLLDHTYNTAVVADIVNDVVKAGKAFGAILLNESVGGLNPSVVETAIGLGSKQIQMPTYSALSHKEKYGDDQKNFPYQKDPVSYSVLENTGALIPEVENILQVMRNRAVFLGTGHLSIKEIIAVVKRAEELGIRVLCNSVSTDIVDLPISVQSELASENVFMEHDYLALTDVVKRKVDVKYIVKQIREVGAHRCVIASDSGQISVPNLIESLKKFIDLLMKNGISETEIDLMTKDNPSKLLNIT